MQCDALELLLTLRDVVLKGFCFKELVAMWKLVTSVVSLVSIGTGASAFIDGGSVPTMHLALMFVEVVIFVMGVFIHFCMPPSNQIA